MAWDPDENELQEAIEEGNVEWLVAVIRWYQDPTGQERPKHVPETPRTIVQLIDDFEATCLDEEYTDPGDAWDVFYRIRELCGGVNP